MKTRKQHKKTASSHASRTRINLPSKYGKHSVWAIVLLLVILAITASLGLFNRGQAATFPTSRNMYNWPFARDSIWNMPIGSAARYVPAGIQNANAWNGRITLDKEHISLNKNDPIKRLTGDDQGYVADVHVRPSMSHGGKLNGCATFLDKDNQNVWQGQPLRLSAGGDPAWRWTIPSRTKHDLKGHGMFGCHGGSRLSGVGGSLRVGELSGSDPIRHVLKVNLFAARFIHPGGGTGYRWPAPVDDGCAPGCYGGSVPALRMGALLALKPDADLGFIRDATARKLATTFKDYGAYVVDDTLWDVHALNIDTLAVPEFDSLPDVFHDDMQKVFTMLHVVDNNSESSVGGGGTPRQPLAPCFDDEPNCDTTGQPKSGDVNGDNLVNASDLSIVLNNYGATGRTRSQGDLDGNGAVNSLDLSQVLKYYGS